MPARRLAAVAALAGHRRSEPRLRAPARAANGRTAVGTEAFLRRQGARPAGALKLSTAMRFSPFRRIRTELRRGRVVLLYAVLCLLSSPTRGESIAAAWEGTYWGEPSGA